MPAPYTPDPMLLPVTLASLTPPEAPRTAMAAAAAATRRAGKGHAFHHSTADVLRHHHQRSKALAGPHSASSTSYTARLADREARLRPASAVLRPSSWARVVPDPVCHATCTGTGREPTHDVAAEHRLQAVRFPSQQQTSVCWLFQLRTWACGAGRIPMHTNNLATGQTTETCEPVLRASPAAYGAVAGAPPWPPPSPARAAAPCNAGAGRPAPAAA